MELSGKAVAQRVRRDQMVGALYIFTSALCFGNMAVFARMAYASGVDIPTMLLLRFSIASVLMWGMLFLNWTLQPGNDEDELFASLEAGCFLHYAIPIVLDVTGLMNGQSWFIFLFINNLW